MSSLNVSGFSPYAGFTAPVAAIITQAEQSLTSERSRNPESNELIRPFVPSDFPNGNQINRNTTQLRILDKLEEQFNRMQKSRDTAGKTLESSRKSEIKNKQTLQEIDTYRQALTSENTSLLKKGSEKINKQKNDKENQSIADQIAKSRGNFNGASSISQMEIEQFKAAAKASRSKKNKKLPKPKGRK